MANLGEMMRSLGRLLSQRQSPQMADLAVVSSLPGAVVVVPVDGAGKPCADEVIVRCVSHQQAVRNFTGPTG